MYMKWPETLLMGALLAALSQTPLPAAAAAEPPAATGAEAGAADHEAAARGAFLEVIKARNARDAAAMEALLPQLEGYPLLDYARYWIVLQNLRAGVDDVPANLAMQDFIARRPGDYLGERAATDYLLIAGPRINPTLFRSIYDTLDWNKTDSNIEAWKVYYELEADAKSVKKAERWLLDTSVKGDTLVAVTSKIIEKDPAFARSALIVIAQKQRWTSAKNLIDAVDPKLFRARGADLKLVFSNPQRWLKRNPPAKADPYLLELALMRLARRDPEAAVKEIKRAGKRLSRDQRRRLWATVGHEGSTELIDDSAAWYKHLGHDYDIPLLANRDEVQGWAARAFMRVGYWTSLKRTIEAMSPALRSDEIWTYWYARALDEHDQKTAARKLWHRIAGNDTYYGRLAREALGLPPPEGSEEKPAVGEKARLFYATATGIQRAKAFYDLGMYFEGHREWNWALRSLPRSEWDQVAELAGEDGLVHRMINTSVSARGHGTLWNQRFPTPYRSAVKTAAADSNLPEAWIYGIMRQESRFMETVGSGAGARGLMQIMPRTGRWLARKSGMKDFTTEDLGDPAVNIRLGSMYLGLLDEAFEGEKVLATAAYNAGPSRARKWQNRLSKPMEGAVFVESIPFYETRDYVKNVFLNTAVYAQRLGDKTLTFRSLLGTIIPGADKNIQLP